MTEAVIQSYLESQVPELRALVEVGVFSQDEIRKIVTQRRTFEYQVKGTGVTKSTWLRYIEYEIQLDQLRRLRAERMAIKKSAAREKDSILRLHKLFSRMTRRFRGDIQMWLRWVRFSKERGSSNVLARSIQAAVLIHPLVPDLWIMAADWQFEYDGNMEIARNLMLRGIRANPQSRQLLLEYFKLELKYLRKVTTRMDLATGASEAPPPQVNDNDAEDLSDDDNELLMLGQEREREMEPLPDVPSFKDSDLAKGKINEAIFDDALQKFPTDHVLGVDLLRMVRSLGGPDVLADTLRAKLVAAFGASEPQFWIYMAKCGEPVEESAQHLSKSDAYEVQVHLQDSGEAVVDVCKAALEERAASAAVFSAYLQTLLQARQFKQAIKVGKTAVSTFPTHPTLWFQYLTAHLAVLQQQPNKKRTAIEALFETSLEQTPFEDNALVRNLYLRFLFAFPEPNWEHVLGAIRDDVNCAVLALELAAKTEHFELNTFGQRLLNHCSSERVFEKLIEVEREPERKRKLLEEACARYGSTNENLWIDWANREMKAGRLERAGEIHWRARHTLKGAALTRYLERVASE